MSTPELINIEQTIDIMEDRRVHRIPLMSGCRNVSSRKDLIVLIKILLDDLEKNDPVLRARIAQVRNAVSFSTIPCRFDVISRAPFSLLGRSWMCFEKSSRAPRLCTASSRRPEARTRYHRRSPMDKNHQVRLQRKETEAALEHHQHRGLPSFSCKIRTKFSSPSLIALPHFHTMYHLCPSCVSIWILLTPGTSFSRWDDWM